MNANNRAGVLYAGKCSEKSDVEYRLHPSYDHDVLAWVAEFKHMDSHGCSSWGLFLTPSHSYQNTTDASYSPEKLCSGDDQICSTSFT